MGQAKIGWFTGFLALLPPRPSRPSRSSPGLATAVFVVSEVGWGRFSFTLPEGKDVAGPDLTLRPLAAVGGQVRRQDIGEPIAGADVAVRLVAGSSTATETDEAGRFALRNLLSGTIRLTASAPGYGGCHRRIPAKPGEEVTDVICELRPLPSLRGRLRGPDGKPLAGATIQVDLTTPGGSRSREDEVKTDAEGKFSVLLQSGRQAVRVQTPEGGQALSPWFTVGEEEQEVEMDFVVRLLTVSGVVRNQVNHEPRRSLCSRTRWPIARLVQDRCSHVGQQLADGGRAQVGVGVAGDVGDGDRLGEAEEVMQRGLREAPAQGRDGLGRHGRTGVADDPQAGWS